MLQKYHPNPLSHFLALHNSQVTHHNVVDAHTLASTLANGHAQFQQHHQQQQQQQQQQHSNPVLLTNHHHPHNTHNHSAIELAAQHLNSQNSPTHLQRDNHHHHHHHHHQQANHNNQLLHHQNNRNIQNPHHHHNHNHHHHAQQLIEAAAAVTANTTLDAGKSFTIAAILGLQKSAMENSRKEYTNNVINLSLNNASHHHQHYDSINNSIQQQQQQPPTNSTPTSDVDDEQPHHNHQHHLQQAQRDSVNSNSNSNSNNNNNRDVNILNTNKSNICNSFNGAASNNNNNNSSSNTTTNTTSNNNNNTAVNNSVNSFNCDSSSATTAANAASVLMNRYLPSAMVNASGSNVMPTAPSLVSFASSPVIAHQHHVRANSFVAAAAAAAAAAANGAPSALQSLQQLHQQHAHQASLSFQREKLKSDHNTKKSSLKNKRVRTIFTPEQLERLEAEFERQQYMVGPERLYLAHTLQLTEAQVKVWFQNRRIKWRKHHLEITQQRLALLRQTQIATNSSNGNSETATITVDTHDDECDDIKREELGELNESRQDTESELSICNDSMDAESIFDGDEET